MRRWRPATPTITYAPRLGPRPSGGSSVKRASSQSASITAANRLSMPTGAATWEGKRGRVGGYFSSFQEYVQDLESQSASASAVARGTFTPQAFEGGERQPQQSAAIIPTIPRTEKKIVVNLR